MMRHLFNTKGLVCGLIVCCQSLCAQAQLIPEDIAFKPTPKIDTTTSQVDSAETQTTETPAPQTRYPGKGMEINPTHNRQSASCSKNSLHHKNIMILAMPRLTPGTANAGNLYQADEQIPKMLGQELNKTQGIEISFYPLGDRLDLSPHDHKHSIRQLASKTNSQFVLSGAILDMSMSDPQKVYNPSLFQEARNYFTDITMMSFLDNRDRRFTLQLSLHDGFTGEQLLQTQVQTHGSWKLKGTPGFTSPQVWQSQYGRRIKKLITKASKQIAANLDCQPFMARVDSRPGQPQLILQGGANNGLNAGDKLHLYQLVNVASNTDYGQYQTRLVKRELQIQLQEVYPSHSLAKILGDDRMNGQYLAVSEE